MRRVGFLSFDWDYEITALYYEGMEKLLSERGDVQLVVFNAFGEYESHEPERGAFEVFSLCDYNDYDGFLIQGNRAWPPEMRQLVVDEVRALGKPVVSISYELEGACFVGTNNYEAMYGLVERVIKDFGCQRPAFVNGLVTSVEAQDRAQGYRDACAQLGVSDVRFFQADWEVQSGARTALKMLERPDDLPDVIFCCNDSLAYGVQTTLQEHGVRIPEDVRITGFDNREIGLVLKPRLTTIDRDYRASGRTAMEALLRLMDGEDVPARVYSPVSYVLSASTGHEYRSITEEYALQETYATNALLTHFYRMLRRFQPSILNSSSLKGILRVTESVLNEMGCANVFLVMNDDYLEHESAHTASVYGATCTLKVRSNATESEAEQVKKCRVRFPSKQILPDEVHMGPTVYVVYPLRHDTTCIGTLVTEGVSSLMKHGFLAILLKLIACSIENMRKTEALRNLNERLDNLYVHDQLTGLFNRFGLYRNGEIAYEHLLRDFEKARFIFVDVDGMKIINDVHGHEAGDLALKDTAGIIRRSIEGENAFAMRYGGDEFLLICRRNLIPTLQEELKNFKQTCPRPYDLSLSMGLFEVSVADNCTIDQAIEVADARMYEVKKARKRARV